MSQTMTWANNFLPRVDADASQVMVDRRVVSLTAPACAASEQYRSLYYRLERLREVRPTKVLALTSAVPGEGKTITALNLAITAARANPERRILLIDADLRRSQVAEYLGIRRKPGLTELLTQEAEVKQAVRRFRSLSLAVLPAGATPEEPTQLLASPAMKHLLHGLRESFDEIYIDLPPTLPFADASILGANADGVLVVIRANSTPMRLVNHGIEQLANVPLLGCVLNGAEMQMGSYMKRYK